jgi:hypothetical protein
VIKSLKKKSELWSAARGIAHDSVRDMAHDSARSIAHDSALRDMAFESARGVAWYTARDATYSAAYSAGWDGQVPRAGVTEAKNAILALIVYDDCDQYLQMTYEQLKVYAVLSEKPQAVLLLPMVYVKEQLNERLVTPA